MSSVFSSAVSGMNAAIERLSCVASNIANASSRGKLPDKEHPVATSYVPKDVVAQATVTGEVQTQIVDRTPSYRPMYDPQAPDANAQGLVAEPTVDIAAEIVQALIAETTYKANAKVIGIEKKRQDSLLDTMA